MLRLEAMVFAVQGTFLCLGNSPLQCICNDNGPDGPRTDVFLPTDAAMHWASVCLYKLNWLQCQLVCLSIIGDVKSPSLVSPGSPLPVETFCIGDASAGEPIASTGWPAETFV